LWAFSTLLKAGPESWGFKTQDVRAAADSLYAFMRDNMMKEVDGGKAYHCHLWTIHTRLFSNTQTSLARNAIQHSQ